ncbi:phosphatidylinositol 4,5-bisphosphate 3-kinase catalytic subunit alpha isoform-like [Lingula anatina]|nr:phosphatidylinositol 4,5-bisphosphate 3-kinase catalytic subunit alpha isoform-like [Lingula anatina]|eukprot:XP_013391443.1 phosphatidylinositol 4,5-bisphosphate 3-kinase catalytic subunit alpha isoform-like [Lingula anatina]
MPVSFPKEQQIEEYARWINNLNPDSIHARGSTTAPLIPQNTWPDMDKNLQEDLIEVLKRDPLAEISEQEKELLWKMRNFCKKNHPDSLPKLLAAVKWDSRKDVAQLYMLLREWSVVSPEIALELLDFTYNDLYVRRFAVKCLDQGLDDDCLSRYLLQLVQVLKYEPYLDNDLARFLLKRALLNQNIGHFLFWHLKSELYQVATRQRFGLMLEAFCRGCGAYLKSLVRQVEALDKLTMLTNKLKNEREDQQKAVLLDHIRQMDYLEALQSFQSPLNNSEILGDLEIEHCEVKTSKKRPVWLVWKNPDPMADLLFKDWKIIFKNGDDLRQDMLTLQVIGIMDNIWQEEGLDLRMSPYGCLSTGSNVGMIEAVRNSKTVLGIQKKRGKKSAMQLDSSQLHKWIKEKNKGDKYQLAIETFTKSCAGYCVATFVLGIGDRHPDNIMVNEEGQVFHIDFGHFLDHRKKKFGINRERVPFVLTEDFIHVIAKGADNPEKTEEFGKFTELCGKAYIILRKHAQLFITLFSMMLSCGIPELQSPDDIGYLRKTLAVEKSEEEAIEYFQQNLNEAHGGAWTTKMDWFFHYLKHRNS